MVLNIKPPILRTVSVKRSKAMLFNSSQPPWSLEVDRPPGSHTSVSRVRVSELN